jgi:hypothetical protein
MYVCDLFKLGCEGGYACLVVRYLTDWTYSYHLSRQAQLPVNDQYTLRLFFIVPVFYTILDVDLMAAEFT